MCHSLSCLELCEDTADPNLYLAWLSPLSVKLHITLTAVLWITSNLWHLWRAGQSRYWPPLHMSWSYIFLMLLEVRHFGWTWQKSFVCSASCWGFIGSVLTGDTGPISEHIMLLTPPPFLHALSCGHCLASTGVRIEPPWQPSRCTQSWLFR